MWCALPPSESVNSVIASLTRHGLAGRSKPHLLALVSPDCTAPGATAWNERNDRCRCCGQDEPTNYLDNDTLAALTHALKSFKVRRSLIYFLAEGQDKIA